MEIIGPDALWDNAFRPNSTMLDECVQQYLSDEEYDEFVKIFNYSPYYQKAEFEQSIPVLEGLLETIHMNRYGYSMHEDGMISAILNNGGYNRVYFSASLMESSPSYYEVDSIGYEEAAKRGYLTVYYEDDISLEQFNDEDYFAPLGKETSIERLCTCDRSAIFEDGKWVGYVMKDGQRYSIEEAERLGYIKIRYKAIMAEVSADDYLNDMNNPHYTFYANAGCKIDRERMQVTLPEDEVEKVYVPTIAEKFNKAEKQLG